MTMDPILDKVLTPDELKFIGADTIVKKIEELIPMSQVQIVLDPVYLGFIISITAPQFQTKQNDGILAFKTFNAYINKFEGCDSLRNIIIYALRSFGHPLSNQLTNEEPNKKAPISKSFTTYSCQYCGSPLTMKDGMLVCSNCGRVYYEDSTH